MGDLQDLKMEVRKRTIFLGIFCGDIPWNKMLQGFEADHIMCPSSSSSVSPDKEINKGIAMLHLGRKNIYPGTILGPNQGVTFFATNGLTLMLDTD